VASGFIASTAAVFRAVAEKQLTEGLDNFRVGMPNEFPAEDSAVYPDSYSLCEDWNVGSSVTLGMVITVECTPSTDTFRYVIVQSLDAGTDERLCIAEVAVYVTGLYPTRSLSEINSFQMASNMQHRCTVQYNINI